MREAESDAARPLHDLTSQDLRDALDLAWPEWTQSSQASATLTAILDDGSLAEIARIGESTPCHTASDIWSDAAWTEIIDSVRTQGPRLHVDSSGRTLVPVTCGPLLYGALEMVAAPGIALDTDTLDRINESLSPLLADVLTP